MLTVEPGVSVALLIFAHAPPPPPPPPDVPATPSAEEPPGPTHSMVLAELSQSVGTSHVVPDVMITDAKGLPLIENYIERERNRVVKGKIDDGEVGVSFHHRASGCAE